MNSGDAPLVCAHHPIALRAAIAMRDKGSAAEAQGVRPRFHVDAEEQPGATRAPLGGARRGRARLVRQNG
jgi:hypothetical protein